MSSPNIIDLPLRKRNAPPIIEVEDLSLWYGGNRALDCVSFEVFPGEVLALIGGPGCGLSTALACLNGSLEDSPCVEMAGEIRVNGQRVGGGAQGSAVHRCRIGWVARHPDLPAGSMFNNVARYAQKYGLFDNAEVLAAHVEACLRRAHLWEAVNGDVHGRAAASLPAALRMRLGLARAMSARPDLVLLDEPTCGLAPDAAAGINAVMADIKRDHTLVIATRCMRQVQEIADRVAFFHMGRLLELRDTAMFFAAPATPEAQSFVAGCLG